jgi:hypothetical protein
MKIFPLLFDEDQFEITLDAELAIEHRLSIQDYIHPMSNKTISFREIKSVR